MADKSNLEWALEYARQGWAVFPCYPGSKKPMVREWTPYQTRPPTEAQIEKWWTATPDANIAVVTGKRSGLVVIDVDPQHGGKADGLPPSKCVQYTRNGGTQHFYEYPGGVDRVPNQTDVMGTGRDIRADGGYVVAPPSRVEADRDQEGDPIGPGKYSWKQFTGLGTDLPDWAIAPPLTDDGEPVTDKWLDELLMNGAKPGERNDSLIRMSGYYASKSLPRDAALTMCHQWNERLKNPLPKDEVDVTVQSAYKMERRRQREKEPKVIDNELLPMTNWDDYMTKHGASEIKWTIKDWLPSATIAFFISPPQSYKTFLTFDLACAIASGQPFLGQYPVLEPGPVAIFQQEDPHSNIAERLGVISFSRVGVDYPSLKDGVLTIDNITHKDVPLYIHEERKLRFDDMEIMGALEAWVAKYRPRVVIIDPLYSAVDTANDEYMAKAARKMMRLKTMRDKYGVSFIIVHHTNKSMDTWDRQKVWGSQFINAYIETSWLVKKVADEDASVIKRHFKVSGTQPFVKTTFDMETEQIPCHYNVDCVVISAEEAERVMKNRNAKGEDVPNQLEKPILKFLKGGPAALPDIAAATNRDSQDIQTALRGLLAKHRVKQDAAGVWETLDVDGLG